MSRNEQQTFGKALAELRTVRENAPSSRIFYICANNAWDWAMRRPDSWFAWDGPGMVWVGPTDRQRIFHEHLLALVSDFDAVTSIVYRLDWLLEKHLTDNTFVTPDDMSTFLATDVHAFHAEYRSLMDTLSHVINVGSSRPGTVPTESFRALRKWCAEKSNRSNSILNEEVTKLIAEAYWFIELRDLRDRITHRQSDAVVRIMSPPDEIVFGTLKGGSNELYEGPNAFQYNGWIYFRAHAGYYLGRLLFLLNAVCAMAAEKLNFSLVDTHWSTNRFPAMNRCIDYAISSLQSGFPIPPGLRLQPEKLQHTALSQHRKLLQRAYHRWEAGGQRIDSELSDWLLSETEQLRWLDS